MASRFLLSRRAKEPATIWMERIQAHQQRLKDRVTEHAMYRDARRGNFPQVLPGARPGAVNQKVEQVNWNLVGRICDRSQTACFDDSPDLTFPRDRPGEAPLAEGIERLLGRVTEAGRLPDKVRDGVPNVYTDGSFLLYVGLPYLQTRREVQVAAEGAGAAIAAGHAGVPPEPVPGQDHEAISKAALDIAGDPEEIATNTPEQTAGLVATGAAHAEAAEDADEEPVEWNHERGRPFFERLNIETQGAWSAYVSDFDETRWAARRICLEPEEARNHPGFRKAWREKLKPQRVENTNDEAQRIANSGDSPAPDELMVVVWEVWDRVYRARHFVAEGMDEYGEKDEAYPYVKRGTTDTPAIRGFFPFVQFAPWMDGEDIPIRSCGIPGFRKGWAQQIKIIKIDSYLLNAIKRAAVDVYLADGLLSDTIRGAIGSGIPGTIAPVTLSGNQRSVRDLFAPLEFTPPLPDLATEKQHAVAELCAAYDFPISELTSQPQADTLGQEELAMASGRRALGAFVRHFEVKYGRVLDIVWDLIRECVPPEDVVAWMGQDFQAQFDAWQNSPLEDEQIRVVFGADSRDDNVKKAEKILALYDKVAAVPGPFPGIPKYDADPLLQDAARKLGQGEIALYQPSKEEIAAALMAQRSAAQEKSKPPSRGRGGSPGAAKQPEKAAA